MSAEVRERAFEPFFTTKGRDGHRPRPRRGVWYREAAPRPRRDRVDAGRGNDDSARVPAARRAGVETPTSRRRASASRDRSCSSRIIRTAASSCRRCWSPTATRSTRRSGVEEAMALLERASAGVRSAGHRHRAAGRQRLGSDRVRARAVAVAAHRRRHRMGAARRRRHRRRLHSSEAGRNVRIARAGCGRRLTACRFDRWRALRRSSQIARR